MSSLPPIEVKVTADTAQAEAGLKRVAGSTKTLQKNTKLSSGSMRMLTQQFSQVAQQATATGQPLQALAVQAADIGLAFGTMGTIAGALIGITMPALISAFAGGADQSKAFDDAIDGISDALTNANEVIRISSMTTEELIETYGRAHTTLTATMDLLNEIAANKAHAAVDELSQSLAGLLAVAGDGEARSIIAETFNVDIFFAFTKAQKAAREEARLLTSEFLNAQMVLKESNGDIDVQLAAMQRLIAAANELSKADGKITEEEQRIVDELAEAIKKTIELKAATDALAESASRVSYPSGWTFDPTTDMPPRPMPDEPRPGIGRVDPLARNLERLQKSLATETELLNTKYAEQNELLQQAFEKRMLTQEEFQNLSLRSAQEYQDALSEIDRSKQKERLGAIGGAFGDLASLMSTENKKLFKIGKAAAIAEATVSGYQAAVDAWAKGMKVGGPPVAAAFTAASLARTGAMIAGISSQQIGGGGGSATGGGGTATAPTAPAERTVSEIRFMGSLGADGQTIIDIINSEYERGNFVRAVVG